MEKEILDRCYVTHALTNANGETMMKYILTVNVDEAKVIKMSGCDNLEDAISQEAGWMAQSGIFLESYERIDEQSDFILKPKLKPKK